MKVAEILREGSYLKDMERYILDLLVACRANRIAEVDFGKLLKDVRTAGFPAVDQEFLKDFLTRQSWVSDADPEGKITLQLHEPDPTDEMGDAEAEEQAEEPPEDKAKTNVADKAKKQAQKAMKEK